MTYKIWYAKIDSHTTSCMVYNCIILDMVGETQSHHNIWYAYNYIVERTGKADKPSRIGKLSPLRPLHKLRRLNCLGILDNLENMDELAKSSILGKGRSAGNLYIVDKSGSYGMVDKIGGLDGLHQLDRLGRFRNLGQLGKVV